VTPGILTLCEEAKRLTALPAPVFAPQMAITVADAIILKYAAPTDGVAVAVLQQCIAATAGTQEDFCFARKRPALVKSSLQKVAGSPKKRFSPESPATRLTSPFFLAPATTYPQVIALAQQVKVNAARAEAKAARPVEG
jgi:hypothetical protein